MFGSNFSANFSLPDFPNQGIDPQGGLFGVNTPPQSDPAAAGSVPTGNIPPTPQPAAPAAGLPGTPQAPALGAPSPLGGGVLSPSGMQGNVPPPDPATAPAAGVGSQFGKGGL